MYNSCLLYVASASREPSLCSWPLGPASAPEKPRLPRFAVNATRCHARVETWPGHAAVASHPGADGMRRSCQALKSARFPVKTCENGVTTGLETAQTGSRTIGFVHILKQNYIFVLQTSLWLSCGYRWRRQSCHKMFIDPKISQRFGTFWNFGHIIKYLDEPKLYLSQIIWNI